ncbi:MAG: ABC transporter substrate-binding protein [Acetobacteraceae bacterium]
MKHLAAIVTALIALAAPAAAQPLALEKPDLALAVGGSISQMNKVAFAIALNKGCFQQEGLRITPSAFASGTAALQALVAGSADVAEGAFEHTLRMQAKGVNLTCLATFGRYPGNVLVVRSALAGQIHGVTDLRGKTIGISAPGASTQNFVAQLMERAGVSWKSATYISVGTGSSAVAALRTGKELDALVNLDPAINELVAHGEATVLVDSRTETGSREAFGGEYLADCLFVHAEFLKTNPRTSQALANAIVHAMQWLKTASIDDIMASLPREYYRADEAIYRESLARNLAAFTWDGIVTDTAAKNVLTSIAVLEPALRNAKIDLALTHDNALIERALSKYGTK